jgi:hypothetical protein
MGAKEEQQERYSVLILFESIIIQENVEEIVKQRMKRIWVEVA